MANQQPARPWFRVASLSRPAPPPSQPQPQPPAPAPEVTAPPQPRPFRTLTTLAPPAATQPPATRPPLQQTGAAAPSLRPPNDGSGASVQPSPAVRADGIVASSLPSSPRPAPPPTSSLPSSPVRKPAVPSVPASPVQAAQKTSSLPSSPVNKPVSSVPNSPKPVPAASSVRNSPAIKAVSEPSPRSIKPAAETPPQSPKRNPTAPPPSPLTLPPSQLKPEPQSPPEAEQKTVVLQKSVENHSTTKKKLWPSGMGSEGGAWNPLMGLRGKEENHNKAKKNLSDSEDKGTRIVTIAGENRGALMELFQSPRKWGNPGTRSGSSSGEDGEGKRKGGWGRGKGATPTPTPTPTPMRAVMNSNVQGINNSIMFNSSCNHHDPGVHVSLSTDPSDGSGSGGLYQVKDHHSSNGSGYQS